MFQDSVTTVQDSVATILPTSDSLSHGVSQAESLIIIRDSLQTVIDSLQNSPHMLEHLNALSEYLGITADKIYNHFYIQALIVQGIYGIILGVICIIFSIVLFHMLVVKYNAHFRERRISETEILDQAIVSALGIAIVICIISAIVNLVSGIPHTLNPKLFAIIELVEFFHPR